MNKLKKNVIGNYGGQIWIAVMQFIFIPVYIKYLGVEAYGLVGVYATMQATLGILDMGMTPTVTREMARYTAGVRNHKSTCVLLYSIERIGVIIAIIIGFSVWLISEWLASNWLNVASLSIGEVKYVLIIIGWVVSLRFIESLYRGVLIGIQAQLSLNVIVGIFTTIRCGGVILVLSYISNSIFSFFIWQIIVAFLTTLSLKLYVQYLVPKKGEIIKFSFKEILTVWNFAKGMLLTTILSLALTHFDKILLSNILTLEKFALYMLASTVSGLIMMIVTPLAQGFYPRFTELVSNKKERDLSEIYHLSSQLMSVLVGPVALLLSLKSKSIFYIWTGEYNMLLESSGILSIMVLGTFMLGLMNLPYMMQLAHGWSMFSAKVNAVIVVIQLPTLYYVSNCYGGVGAAWVWFGITFIYISIVVNIMHFYIMKKDRWSWYFYDNILPLGVSAIIGYLGVIFLPEPDNRFLEMLILFCLWVLMTFGAILVSNKINKNFLKFSFIY